MARPKISKMVTDRQRSCEFVEEFVKTHSEEVARALTLLLEEDAEEGGNGDGDDDVEAAQFNMPAFFARLQRRLRNSLDRLVEAEKRHLDELANDAAPRRRRDRARAALRGDLFPLRELFRGAFGRDKAEEAGFERRIAGDAVPLLRQGQRIEARLRDPQLELGRPRYGAVGVTRKAALSVLEPRLEELRQAIDAVTHEVGKAQGTKIAKDRAMDAFDETYLLVSRTLVAAFNLAGKHELGAQIPTTVRRRSRRGTAAAAQPLAAEPSEAPESSE